MDRAMKVRDVKKEMIEIRRANFFLARIELGLDLNTEFSEMTGISTFTLSAMRREW